MTYLPTFYQQFIHKSRYARWIEGENRRETWEETVDRYLDFMEAKVAEDHPMALAKLQKKRPKIRKYFVEQKALPSMRSVMTAGKALERDNIAGYNCSYVAIDHPRAFDEILYILMCGTGVGFSVERQAITHLPAVAEEFYPTDTCIKVRDSRIGWATAFRELLSLLWAGQIPSWDLTNLRPAGARLKTFGGRSSGPEPLNELFKFAVNQFQKSAGRKLTSLECHDLVCKVADIVVVGGVRRSALISLSNVSDDRMRGAKSGQWWVETPHRKLANNSAAYNEIPEFPVFLQEWKALYDSKAGERGIFSREASRKHVESTGIRDPNHDWGTNPCSEIILRSCQVCNLSEIVVRPEDTLKELKEKAEIAAILGTLQSTVTDFRYLRKIWRKNTEEERLLGVSLTGIMDHPVLSDPNNDELPKLLTTLKDYTLAVNHEWADALGIEHSAAVTCVKPSGTVSQLVNSSSGIHARFSPYYVRTVRADKKDPLALFMMSKGFPCEDDVTNSNVLVFSFPIKSPEASTFVSDLTALKQLEVWKIYQDYWTHHKPSCTIYYTDKEYLGVGDWVYNNFKSISGVSFLPHTDHIYAQAPYQEISQEKYEQLVSEMPAEFDWADLTDFEKEDTTTGTQELACSGGACEIVDLTTP